MSSPSSFPACLDGVWRLVAEDCEDDGQCRFSSLRFRRLGWVCVSFSPGFYILSPSVLRWRDKDDGGADPRLCVVPLLFLSFSVSLFFFFFVLLVPFSVQFLLCSLRVLGSLPVFSPRLRFLALLALLFFLSSSFCSRVFFSPFSLDSAFFFLLFVLPVFLFFSVAFSCL